MKTTEQRVVENKVYSKEGKDQTKRYHQLVGSICKVHQNHQQLFDMAAKAASGKSQLEVEEGALPLY